VPTTRFPSQQISASLSLLMLALLGLVVLIGVGATASGVALFARVAYWSMAVGLAAGLVALTAQLVDLVTTPAHVAGRRHLGVLCAGTTGMLVTFAAVWSVRDDGRPGPAWLLAVEAGAFALGTTAAVYARWFLSGGTPPRPAVMFPSPRYRIGPYRPGPVPTVPYRIGPVPTVPFRVGPPPGIVPHRFGPLPPLTVPYLITSLPARDAEVDVQ
jgi:hypothetical protein